MAKKKAKAMKKGCKGKNLLAFFTAKNGKYYEVCGPRPHVVHVPDRVLAQRNKGTILSMARAAKKKAQAAADAFLDKLKEGSYDGYRRRKARRSRR